MPQVGRDILQCGGGIKPEYTSLVPSYIPWSPCNLYSNFGDLNQQAGESPGLRPYGTTTVANMVEPRIGAAVAQLTPFDIMVIGGGIIEDVGGATTEFLHMGPVNQTSHIRTQFFAPGPRVPGVEALHYACAVALGPEYVVVTGGMVDGAPSKMALKYVSFWKFSFAL